jgi:mRNA-degrading endonuclease YafQ of YafQ-DinJ toxin-antitoxin module
LILHYTTQFKKDYKKNKKQKKDLLKLKIVIQKLFDQQTLEPKYKDHQHENNRSHPVHFFVEFAAYHHCRSTNSMSPKISCHLFIFSF